MNIKLTMAKKMVLTCICTAAVLLLSAKVLAADSDDKKIKVWRVEIVFESTTVRVNQERTLYAEVFPYDADDQTICWSSGNPEIVSVNEDGVITGISPGTAEVIATSGNGKSASCKVTVPDTVLTEIELQADNSDYALTQVSGGEVLNAATLRFDAENAVKNHLNLLTYNDKTQVSTAALRSAAFSAAYYGGSVSVRFRTLDGSSVQGQLTVDPEKAPSENMDLQVGIYTTPGKTSSYEEAADAHFGAQTAIVLLEHGGSYGMTVDIAAKVDLTGMDASNLKLYHATSGAYTLLKDQSYYVDENGYVHFSTDSGGTIVIVG